jgi:hypothetical protein
MGFLNSIGHAISTGYHDIFGGGNNNAPITTTTTTMVQLRKPQSQNNVSQPQNSPQLDLTLQKPNSNPFGQPTVDASTLTKAAQFKNNQPTTETTTVAPAQPHPSILRRATSIVGNVGKAVASPFINVGEDVSNTIGNAEVTVGKKLGFTPKTGVQTNEEQFGKSTLGIPTQENTPKNFGLNTAQVALTVLAPGIDNAAEAAGSRLLPRFADTGLMKIGSRAVSNAGIGGGFNTAAGIERGDSGGKLLKDFGEGAAAGGVGGVVFTGIPMLRKGLSRTGIDESLPAQAAETTAETATDIAGPQTAEELAAGVKSANPNPTPEPAPITTEPAGAQPVAPGKPINVPDGTTPTPGDTSALAYPTKLPPNIVEQSPLTPIAPRPAPVRTAPLDTPVSPAPVIDNTPAYVRKAAQAQTDAEARRAAENDPNLGGESPLDRPTFMHNQDIKAVIADGEQQLNEFINEHPEATRADIEQAQATIRSQVLDQIQKLQGARADISTETTPAATAMPVAAPNALEAATAVAEQKPVVQALDAQGNPMQVTAKTANQQAVDAGVSPNQGAPTNPAEVQAVDAQRPAVPLQSDRTAPNAPNVRPALEKQLGDVADNLKGVQSEHAVLSNPELDAAAQRVIATLDDPSLLDRYASGAKFTSTSDTAQGYAALDRLSEMTKSADPAISQKAGQAIDNILEAAEQGISEGGRQLNYAQTLFDKLPRPAKVAALIRNIDKQREKLNLPLVKDDPALQQQVNATVDRYLTLGEDLQSKVAAIEGRAEEIQQAAREGKTSKADIKEAQQLQSARIKAQLAVEKNQGDLAQYYDTMVPGKKFSQGNVGDATRTLMLSSVAGRLNDPITTGANMIHTLINMGGESLIGKTLNAGRALLGRNPGKYLSKGPSLKTVARGSTAMLSKTAGELKGDVYTGGDLRKALQTGDMGGRTQLSRATGLGLTKTRRFIRAGAEFATNLSGGIKTAELERGAYQEGRQLGLKGTDLKAFTAARAASPTRLEEEAGNRLWDEVNNMNDNWLTSGLEKLSGAMTHVPVIGQTMKNLTFPFTRWIGGQAYNMVADKNAIANVVKFADAFRKGDSQAMVSNVAKLAQNATAAMTLGYGLAKAGVLTTTDAQGYNDNGLYLHINGRYIPASFLGFFAPSMILGYSTYHGFNDSKDGKVSDKILATTSKTLDATWRAVNGNTLTGQDNATLKALGNWGSRQGGIGAGDVAATVAGQTAGQFIPGAAGDVNAILNNGTNLNPTHEAALTKVENPSSKSGHATDIPKTALNQLKNRIPGLSQELPRKAGVAAPDEYDRLFRGGSRDTGATIQAAKDKQTILDQSAFNAAHDIPDPNGKYDSKKGESFEGAVAARIANNEYDKAIPALQQKLSVYQGDKNVDPKTVQGLQDHIKELNVTKLYGDKGQQVRKLYLDTNLSDWRNMGDPTSDSYDPTTYQLLYNYDTQLAKQGVSDAKGSNDKNKFTAKKDGSGSGRGKSGASLIKDNTIGSTPNLGMISFGDLAPRKVGTSAAIPTIQQIEPGQLIKKRAISVTAAR